jgi:hypothetical protein
LLLEKWLSVILVLPTKQFFSVDSEAFIRIANSDKRRHKGTKFMTARGGKFPGPLPSGRLAPATPPPWRR